VDLLSADASPGHYLGQAEARLEPCPADSAGVDIDPAASSLVEALVGHGSECTAAPSQ